MGAFRRALALALAASLALGAAACDALLGLGDYQSAACVGNDCPDAGRDTGSDVDIDQDAGGATDDAAPDASTAPTDASVDGGPTPFERWAHWTMPNPDASIGGDSSAPLPHPMAYDAGGSGSVFDVRTQLTWEKDGSTAASDYATAARHCAVQGMRLPTRIELVSLVDFTQSPSIDSSVFTGTQSAPYWTSSPVATGAGGDASVAYWTVDFTHGLVGNDPNVQGKYVRCVGMTPW